jgi:hypothetical protein
MKNIILPRLLLAALVGMGGFLNSARAADGANLQPAYYNGGNVNFGWSLMKSQAPNIKRLRIEIDTSRVSTATAKGWIDQAKANGFTDLICTFHQFGGSDNASDLLTAANWWKNNYNALGGGFTINLCNEWADHNITSSAYASAYNSAISIIRQVYSGPIVVDIPGWGQETLTALNAYKSSSPVITDGNLIVSTHIYPGNWNQARNHVYQTSDMNDLSAIGRTVIIGEFGTGAGSCDWSGCVDFGKAKGWSALAWSWNGDGGVLNMVSPSWASNATATSFSTNSYFSTVYPKLSGGGGGGGGGPVPAGTYSLQNLADGKMLDNLGATADGATVAQWADGSSNNQRWVLSYVGASARLTCVTGGKSLDNLAHTTDGSTVGQWTTNASSNQLWTLQSQGNGYYKIVNVANGKCLDTGGATTDGGVMKFFASSGSFNQQWRFVTP